MGKSRTYRWQGRVDDENNWADFRYHQIIGEEGNASLIGFCCDEGVRRNNGRVGAAEGPNAIRSGLANIAWRLPKDTYLVDVGNVICEGTEMEKAQVALGEALHEQYSQSRTPFVLGGGHETFYGHYLGARSFLGKEKKIGIINIDAHFDMRPYDEQTSSGTMFRQILEQDENTGYLVLGIQKFGNTESLFEKADELGCEYILEEEMNEIDLKRVIESFSDKFDAVIVTLCMDVVDAAHAPGVSAPSAFGLSPKVVRDIIRIVMSNPKALSFDIAEVNPSLDPDGRTVKLGASFVNEAIMSTYTRENSGVDS